jgi:HEPN domain-containing protein
MEQNKTDYWINLSEYDLDIAETVFEKGYYLHAGFMCHQSVEKLLKALFVSATDSVPPKTHNLDRIIKDCGQEDLFSKEQFDFLDELTPLNIQARYPLYKDMLYKLIDKEKALQILNRTREMHAWLKEKMN